MAGAEGVGAAKRASNAEVSAVMLRRLRLYLQRGDPPPMRRDVVNVAALARDAGLDRQFLYANAMAADLLATHAAALGWPMPKGGPVGSDPAESDVPQDVGSLALARSERRVKALEEQVATLRAEIHDLRGRVLRCRHLDDHLAATGILPR